MHRSLVTLLIGFGLLLAACGPNGPRGPSTDAPATATEVLRLVNTARASGTTCGSEPLPPASPLRSEGRLILVAQAHSDDMAATGKMSHQGSDGSSPGERIARAGYGASAWGENVARDYGSAESVMEGWLGSPGHCRNIVNPRFTELGAARSGTFWTMVLAHPR